LALLASREAGCTQAIMAAHGFSILDMAELVFAREATMSTEHFVAGRRRIEVARLQITEAGRRALLQVDEPVAAGNVVAMRK
jgi:hypothetical protein